MFDTIIFDLDDTLIDTTRLLIPLVNTPKYTEAVNSPLPLIEGSEQNLIYLKTKYRLALVTQGDTKIQNQKIASANISSFFDLILCVDLKTQHTKFEAFKGVLATLNLSDPTRVLSIGNRRSTDIRLAKRAGLKTCLFVYGEHKNELPEGPEDFPDFEFFHHRDLIKTCRL